MDSLFMLIASCGFILKYHVFLGLFVEICDVSGAFFSSIFCSCYFILCLDSFTLAEGWGLWPELVKYTQFIKYKNTVEYFRGAFHFTPLHIGKLNSRFYKLQIFRVSESPNSNLITKYLKINFVYRLQDY